MQETWRHVRVVAERTYRPRLGPRDVRALDGAAVEGALRRACLGVELGEPDRLRAVLGGERGIQALRPPLETQRRVEDALLLGDGLLELPERAEGGDVVGQLVVVGLAGDLGVDREEGADEV